MSLCSRQIIVHSITHCGLHKPCLSTL